MLNNTQHYFDESYRKAHDVEYIEMASHQELASVISELNNEYLETVNLVITDDIIVPMQRFMLYSELIQSALQQDDFQEKQSLHLQIAICTGSLMEGVLQFFLLAYAHEFLQAHWKQWEDTAIDELSKSIKECLRSLVGSKIITGKQKDTLLNLLKLELKIRKEGKTVQTIMLDELIGFCRAQEIFYGFVSENATTQKSPGNEYEHMDCIRDSRNNIHVFTKHPMPDYQAVLKNLRNYCKIVRELISRVEGRIDE